MAKEGSFLVAQAWRIFCLGSEHRLVVARLRTLVPETTAGDRARPSPALDPDRVERQDTIYSEKPPSRDGQRKTCC